MKHAPPVYASTFEPLGKQRRPGLTFGANWNDEVEARSSAKAELRRVLIDHRGLTEMKHSIPGDLPHIYCPGCYEIIKPPSDACICPNVMAEVNECVMAGCTIAEVQMVWSETLAELDEAWEAEMHRCHQ